MKYEVLKEGVSLRMPPSGGLVYQEIGAVVEISDRGSIPLLERGFIQLAPKKPRKMVKRTFPKFGTEESDV